MITGIHMQHFRSYEDASYDFENGVTIIVGPNASGKTNLLEAILLLARGKSYRAKDPELITHGHEWTRIDGQILDGGTRTVKMQPDNKGVLKKTFEIGERNFSRLTNQRQLPLVLFEPDHLQLLGGPPDARRLFLDDLLEQIDPEYSRIRAQYRRVLAQRNSLLKQPVHQAQNQLFIWNIQLSDLGGKVARARVKLVTEMNESLSTIYSSIAGKESTALIQYISKFSLDTYETSLLRKLESNTELEFARGYTLYGPHREDFELLLNNNPAATTASRGEVRTLLLSLKVLELQIITKTRQEKPLLLLDDVFSELDGRRRQSLTNYVAQYQTFITTTDADLVMQHFAGKAGIIPTAS